MTKTILLAAGCGLLAGYFIVPPEFIAISGNVLIGGLCVLMFFVGMDLGISGTVVPNFKKVGWRVVVFPIMLSGGIRVVEMSNNDAWVRDCGPTFVVDDKGHTRGIDWEFNAWGGLVDGLYFPWDRDNQIARKICELEGIDTYHTDGFVMEGGSIHSDGQGTAMTTEMCLLSRGRNPSLSKKQIESMNKFAEAVAEVADVEKAPKFEGRSLIMFLTPKADK